MGGANLEQLQLLLIGEPLDLSCLDVSLQMQLLPSQYAEGAVKGLLHVCNLLLQHLLLILQLVGLQRRTPFLSAWLTLQLVSLHHHTHCLAARLILQLMLLQHHIHFLSARLVLQLAV